MEEELGIKYKDEKQKSDSYSQQIEELKERVLISIKQQNEMEAQFEIIKEQKIIIEQQLNKQNITN